MHASHRARNENLVLVDADTGARLLESQPSKRTTLLLGYQQGTGAVESNVSWATQSARHEANPVSGSHLWLEPPCDTGTLGRDLGEQGCQGSESRE